MQILLSVFAAVGLTYLFRDLLFWWIYRKPRRGAWLELSLEGMSRSQLCDWLRACAELRESFQGKALVRGVRFLRVRKGELSFVQAVELAELFGIPVKGNPPRRSRR